MTRTISAENFEALKRGELIARDFVWFVVREFATGAPVTDGYWSDDHDTTAEVIDPETGGATSRFFRAGGGLIAISDIPLVSALTVQQITITLSKVSNRVNDLVRAYDCKQGRVEVFRGLYHPGNMRMVDPAYPRFAGFINEMPITTPRENEDGGDVVLTCTSHSQEITRASPDTRSDASQRRRNPSDNFYQDVAVVGGWPIWWGRDSSTAPATSNAVERRR